jgi:RNA polymerase sigma-70 factor (ECF subfamily)
MKVMERRGARRSRAKGIHVRAYRFDTDDNQVSLSAEPFDELACVNAARGDPAAFAPLYERYAVPVYRYCYRRTGDEELANDLTARIFVRAIEKLHQFRPMPGATFRSWLFTIARSILTDHWRRIRPVPLSDEGESWLQDSDPGPEEIAVHRSQMRELRRVLGELPDRQREVVELRLAGLTTTEIAAAMEMTVAGVKSAQTRAYSRIRELMNTRPGDVR